MNLSSVEHHSRLPFRQPLARDRVRFRLLAAAGDIAACSLICWKRSSPEARRETPMRRRHSDGLRDEWLADVDFAEEAHYIKYFFRLTDNSGLSMCLCENGLCEREPAGGFYELLQVNQCDIISPPEWARGCVYYQVFPDRFFIGDKEKRLRAYEPWDARPTRDSFMGGDLRGIREKLPYLKDLGVECLYLNPVFEGDFNHKYATVDYYRVDEDFGGDEALISFVDAAHGIGIRVVLDGVFNHVSTRFPPFADLMRNGEKSPYIGWFYPKRFPIEISESCYECVGDYAYMPRLRVCDPGARQYVLNVMLHWLKAARVDGWRLDVADELDERALRFWREGIKAEYPNAVLLAETWGDASRLVNAGDMCDGAMNYPLRDAVLEYFAASRLSETEFDKRLQRLLMRHPDKTAQAMYNCLGSHDTARFLTECGGDERRAKMAYAFQMLFVGSPAIYYGDELCMTGESDPDCRAGMPWEREGCGMREYIKSLTALRKRHPALRVGGCRTLLADDARRLFAFERVSDEESVRAVFNMGGAPQTMDFTDMAEAVSVLPMSVEIVIKKRR